MFLALLAELKSWLTNFLTTIIFKCRESGQNEYLKLKKEVEELRKLSHSISAQQEFAKWARNDRKLQKEEQRLIDLKHSLLKVVHQLEEGLL